MFSVRESPTDLRARVCGCVSFFTAPRLQCRYHKLNGGGKESTFFDILRLAANAQRRPCGHVGLYVLYVVTGDTKRWAAPFSARQLQVPPYGQPSGQPY